MTVESLKPIDMDINNLTLMGVPFPDATTLERVTNAIVSKFVRAVKEAEYAG
ncbi:MAG: hypothetical protein LBD35_00420 [Prevotellaceae bacterium]|jgi:hypothetical protein|nr:hypothetical protein [Prevotellaceae bacterium]